MAGERSSHLSRSLNSMPIALPYLAGARASGSDAGTFLHAQLTADIAALGDGEASFACYCSPRGQVYGLLLVCRDGQEYDLIADATLMPGMLRRLSMFVLRSQVRLAHTAEREVCGLTASETTAGIAVDCAVPQLDLAYRFEQRGACAAGKEADWKQRELARNVVWLEPATTERFIPQMLGLERIGSVSFSKGCYPGQEIIARARYLGKVKRTPRLLQLTDAPDAPHGASLRLRDDPQWLQGTLVDSVPTGSGGALWFVVAPFSDRSTESLEYEGRRYRCATM